MSVCFRTVVVSSLLAAAACSDSKPDTVGDPGQPLPVPLTEQTATSMGVSIMSSDALGRPRLIRAIAPRAVSVAGMTPADAAREHIASLAPLWVQQARPATLVEGGTQTLRNGATVVKLVQQVDGVVVDQGELRVMMHADGSFAAASGTLVPSTMRPTFMSSPREALDRALDDQFGTARPAMAIHDAGASDGWHTLEVASTPELQISRARARRELVQVGDQLVEAWAVEVAADAALDPLADLSMPASTEHSYLVADKGGQILRDVDLVQNDAFVYRAYAETTGVRRPLDGPLQSFAPHPTGMPDGSAPSFVPPPLAVMDAFNGPKDSWLPSNATTTSGNNVEAFADLDNNAVFSAGDIRPEVKSGRILNYTYHPELEPLATPDQSKAATVNAFFLVNWMHDWFYDSGFTEATGNAQRDNYGRGGVANDPIFIAAQAGANVGLRDNANMSTPQDGSRPRMRMYLWTSGTVSSLTTPTGVITSESFAAGPRTFDLTAEVVAGTDATTPFDDGCQPITSAVAGKIVLLTYSGKCGSAATVNSAKAAGAIGVVLADGALDNPRAFAGSAAANIPGLAIGKTDGVALAAAITAGHVTITLKSAISGPERDGDLDNTVVAHEWGHYLHHRLANCGAQQCGGMSEGWGDFNALLMMLREDDNRDGVYAAAPYAIANGTPNFAYYGLRRFPYSRDRTKNDLSFRHIGDENALPTTTPGFPGGANSEVHNTGEVWASMMWEALNAIIDQHGVTIGRRRMSDYVVAGLLLTPPDATFTEGRDAILAAASALDTDDMILMAAAFAGRGAGSCAVSPPNTSPTNAGVVESGTLAGKLSVGGVSLTDDGASCDHDGYLDPGESSQLHLIVANNGILAAEDITVTATTSASGVQLGAPIHISALQPFSQSTLTIPVKLLASAPNNTNVTINLVVRGDYTCDDAGVSVALTVRTGADDVPDASTIDHVETAATPWTATGEGAADFWGRAFEASGNQSFLGKDAGFTTDTQFVSPPLLTSATDPLVVTIQHAYAFESTYDGGVIEVSTDSGATWRDVTELGITPGYGPALRPMTGNPIAGRAAFSGTSAGFPARSALTLDFGTQLAGQSVQLRFRIGTDTAVGASGWDIDDIAVTGITNQPFPILAAEASTCTAPSPHAGSATGTTSAPAVSLAGFDTNQCIADDQ
ncbi:MAG TPA: M36 family metallopeptidase [Kofleriaceae bacterium]|nr:M36 family metallopeptidase [Kofleriaceae bacterium]